MVIKNKILQEEASLKREKLGLEKGYKEIFGKAPLKGINLFLKICANYGKNLEHNKEIIIADFGGGVGIISISMKKFLENKGFKDVKVYLIDVNKKALDSVKDKNITKINKNLLDIKYKEKFDIIIIRAVLHHFNKKYAVEVIKRAVNSLKKKGSLIIANVTGPTREDTIFLEKLYNKLDKFMGAPSGFRFFSTDKEKIKLLKKFNMAAPRKAGAYNTYITTKGFESRYGINKIQSNYIQSYLLNASNKIKKRLRIKKYNGFYGYTQPVSIFISQKA